MKYSTAVVEIKLRRMTDYFYSILFTPLLVVSLLCLSAGWVRNSDQRILILLSSNLFLVTYKIWFRATQLPPVTGPVLAVDYIDICWTVCLLCLLHHLVNQWLSEGYTPLNPRHLEAFSMDDDPQTAQPRSAPVWRICGETVTLIILKVTLPVIFLLCQVVFWCRVAAISTDLQGLIPFTPRN